MLLFLAVAPPTHPQYRAVGYMAEVSASSGCAAQRSPPKPIKSRLSRAPAQPFEAEGCSRFPLFQLDHGTPDRILQCPRAGLLLSRYPPARPRSLSQASKHLGPYRVFFPPTIRLLFPAGLCGAPRRPTHPGGQGTPSSRSTPSARLAGNNRTPGRHCQGKKSLRIEKKGPLRNAQEVVDSATPIEYAGDPG